MEHGSGFIIISSLIHVYIKRKIIPVPDRYQSNKAQKNLNIPDIVNYPVSLLATVMGSNIIWAAATPQTVISQLKHVKVLSECNIPNNAHAMVALRVDVVVM